MYVKNETNNFLSYKNIFDFFYNKSYFWLSFHPKHIGIKQRSNSTD